MSEIESRLPVAGRRAATVVVVVATVDARDVAKDVVRNSLKGATSVGDRVCASGALAKSAPRSIGESSNVAFTKEYFCFGSVFDRLNLSHSLASFFASLAQSDLDAEFKTRMDFRVEVEFSLGVEF